MTYDLIETSDALGEPVELYKFAYGSGAANKFTYTDGDFETQVETDVFAPLPIERNAVLASQTLDKSTLEVTVPVLPCTPCSAAVAVALLALMTRSFTMLAARLSAPR